MRPGPEQVRSNHSGHPPAPASTRLLPARALVAAGSLRHRRRFPAGFSRPESFPPPILSLSRLHRPAPPRNDRPAGGPGSSPNSCRWILPRQRSAGSVGSHCHSPASLRPRAPAARGHRDSSGPIMAPCSRLRQNPRRWKSARRSVERAGSWCGHRRHPRPDAASRSARRCRATSASTRPVISPFSPSYSAITV